MKVSWTLVEDEESLWKWDKTLGTAFGGSVQLSNSSHLNAVWVIGRQGLDKGVGETQLKTQSYKSEHKYERRQTSTFKLHLFKSTKVTCITLRNDIQGSKGEQLCLCLFQRQSSNKSPWQKILDTLHKGKLHLCVLDDVVHGWLRGAFVDRWFCNFSHNTDKETVVDSCERFCALSVGNM